MAIPPLPDESRACPTCGEPLQRLPTLDDSGFVTVCPKCSFEPTPDEPEGLDIPESAAPEEADEGIEPGAHFRELVTQYETTSPQGPYPASLLEDLPEETRELLEEPSTPAITPKTEELTEDRTETLRDRGYVVDQDAHGVRISGGRFDSKDREAMSPYDLVRIVADLEGGVLPIDKRVHCLKCDAVIPPNEARCQYCGEPITPSEDTQGEG